MKILIADNDKNFSEELSVFLNTKNMDVVGICEDGAETLEKIKTLKPEVLLLDLVIPTIDGIELLEIISEFDGNRIISIVLSSFVLDKEIVKMCVNFGVRYYMIKPINLESLYKRIIQFSGLAIKPKTLNFKNEKMQRLQNLSNKHDIEIMIAKMLREFGIPPHVRGYRYLKTAISLLLDTPSNVLMTKHVYPEVAKQHDTTPTRVERAIRHAIEVAFVRGDVQTRNSFLGYNVPLLKNKPTNSEFLAAVTDKLKLGLRNIS